MRNLKLIGGVSAAMALATAAYAQPAATNLGPLPDGETRQSFVAVDASTIVWFQFSIAADANDSTNRYLDIYTDLSAGDSEIGLYDAFGNAVAFDDDDGDGLRSALSFGTSSPSQVRPAVGTSATFNSRDGALAAGTYYLALGNFNVTFNAGGWDVFSTNTTAFNNFDVVIVSGQATPPPPPPADRWLESTAGDAGDLPFSAQIPSGSGNLGSIAGSMTAGDVDMYQIDICDVGFFSATTANPDTAIDTQMWLFDANGAGVAFNDDSPLVAGLQSTLTNIYITAPGTYYLALSTYNNDANDEFGQLIWANTPFNTERAPDGPGAFGQVSSWTGGGSTGAYLINLTGACFPGGGGGCAPCAADYDQSGGVDGDDIAAFFADWQAGAACGDVDGSGGVDGDDIGFFFERWQAGGCN